MSRIEMPPRRGSCSRHQCEYCVQILISHHAHVESYLIGGTILGDFIAFHQSFTSHRNPVHGGIGATAVLIDEAEAFSAIEEFHDAMNQGAILAVRTPGEGS